MSDDRQTSQCNGYGDDAAQIYRHLTELESGELLDEFAEKLDAMDDMTFDPELIDQYLAILEVKNPLETEYDANTSLAEFHEKHLLMFQQNTAKKQVARPRRHRLVARLAYVAALVALGSMVAAQAFGVDVFGAVAKWTQEMFHFGMAATQEHNGEDAAVPIDYGVFAALKEAVNANGISELVVPIWCPEGFVPAEEPKTTTTSGMSVIDFPFQNDDQFFSITIQQFKAAKDIAATFFEKDSQDVAIYEYNGISHYMMHNLEQVQAVWSSGAVVVSISGDLSFSDLETMIDSIYGG